MSLKQHLEALNCGFMSMADYAKADKAGKLPSWPGACCESLAKGEYPEEHPLNKDNERKRREASHWIWYTARSERHLFTHDVLEKIHGHMFDCSPSVREWLVQTLYYVGDGSSVPHIKRLLDIEVIGDRLPDTSPDIVTWGHVVLRKLAPKTASRERTFLLVSPDYYLARKLMHFCDHNDMNLWIGGPNSPDIIAVPYEVVIVHKDWMDENSWNEWIIFLKESQGEDRYLLLIITIDMKTSEWTRRELEAQFVDIHKTIFFVSEDERTNILRTVRTWLDSKPASSQEALPPAEVNDDLKSQVTAGNKGLQ